MQQGIFGRSHPGWFRKEGKIMKMNVPWREGKKEQSLHSEDNWMLKKPDTKLTGQLLAKVTGHTAEVKAWGPTFQWHQQAMQGDKNVVCLCTWREKGMSRGLVTTNFVTYYPVTELLQGYGPILANFNTVCHTLDLGIDRNKNQSNERQDPFRVSPGSLNPFSLF